MKIVKSLFIIAAAVVFSCCKTATDAAQHSMAKPLLQINTILDSCENIFIDMAQQSQGDYKRAINLSAERIRTFANVSSVSVLDSIYVDISLKSGLRTTFYANEIDSNGLSVFRGSGSAGSKLLGSNSKFTIKNKKILIYGACAKEFYQNGELEELADVMKNANLGLNVTLLKDEKCTYDVVNHFQDYGFVLIETHGHPNGFKVGTTKQDYSEFANLPITEEEFKVFIDKYEGAGTYDKLQSGELQIFGKVNVSHYQVNWEKILVPNKAREIWLTTTYLKTVPNMPNTVVFGNMCYSGYGIPYDYFPELDPIRTAFLNKNLITYYGYSFSNEKSMPVSNDFSKMMDDSLVHSLVSELDSTGNANLKDDGSFFIEPELLKNYNKSLYFKQYGNPNYSYENDCPSFTDGRDGTVYKTVCIGKQNWMAENLNYDIATSGYVEYTDLKPPYTTVLGRLYKIEDALHICPNGWHLPSVSEYNELLDYLGKYYTNVLSALADTFISSKDNTWGWMPPGAGYNQSGFSARPGGQLDFNGLHPWMISGRGREAYFLTSTGASVIHLTIADPNPSIVQGKTTYGYSCRCIKD
jgi:uncharacterized protein (TIGR02145 family)